MWFIFPQIADVGRSSMAKTYAISSLAEATAYLADAVLGRRLMECTSILTEIREGTAQEIFGTIDALKLRSSMTLFARAAPDSALFRQVLTTFFGGVEDEATERILESQDRGPGVSEGSA